MHTRLLGPADYSEVINLYQKHATHMGVESKDYSLKHTDRLLEEEYLNPEYVHKVLLGTFRDGQLHLCMGIYFWTGLPSCTFLRFASLPGAFPGRSLREPFRHLYSGCLDLLEERGYNRFYLLSSAQHHGALAYLGGTWDRLRLKYLMTVEEVVPSNTRPRYDYVWQMMGNKTWPVPLIVRAGTLLNKYRKLDTEIVSSKALQIWEDTGIE